MRISYGCQYHLKSCSEYLETLVFLKTTVYYQLKIWHLTMVQRVMTYY